MHTKFGGLGVTAVAALLVMGVAEASVAPQSTPAPAVEGRAAMAGPMTVWEYRLRANRICTAAHALLDKKVEASGVQVIRLENLRFLSPADEQALTKYVELARRVVAETLPKLRSVSRPLRSERGTAVCTGSSSSSPRGRRGLTLSMGRSGVIRSSRGWGLSHCTFYLPR